MNVTLRAGTGQCSAAEASREQRTEFQKPDWSMAALFFSGHSAMYTQRRRGAVTGMKRAPEQGDKMPSHNNAAVIGLIRYGDDSIHCVDVEGIEDKRSKR
jgi:hypothetical protein